jgi:hypothetical protein
MKRKSHIIKIMNIKSVTYLYKSEESYILFASYKVYNNK